MDRCTWKVIEREIENFLEKSGLTLIKLKIHTFANTF